jgi:methionine-rich copper-binding protein CopC
MSAIATFTGLGAASAAIALTAALVHQPSAHDTATAVTVAQASTVGASRASPLLGADGKPQAALPQAVPTNPRERTHVALYATLEQAQALDAERRGAVIWVEADCCDENAVAFALDLADGLRTGKHLGFDAPVFVTGENLQMAALIVNRLTEEGHSRVFMVTR